MNLKNTIPPITVDLADWLIIKDILNKIIPDYEVWAFGSRVRGTPKKFSDLDLVIKSEHEISINTLGNLQQAFSDSALPFKVDLIDWSTTTENFRKIIRENYVVLQ